MKQYFLKFTGLTIIVLLLQMTAFTQDDNDTLTTRIKRHKDEGEIIIKHKSNKDTKITVEIKDGQVTVNGKPIEDFNDDDLSIRRSKNDFEDFDAMKLIMPEMPRSPFRGEAWSNADNDNDGIKRSYTIDSKTAFLGVVTESAENGGTEITEVTRASAAEKIGLKKGDVITKIGETKVNSHEDLVNALRHYKPMDKVVVTFKRDGKEQKLTPILGRSSSVRSFNYNFVSPKIKGFSGDMPYVFSFNNSERPRLGIKAQDTEDGKGVKVLDVDDESPADKAGVKEGDIITEFEGKEVNSAESLAALSRENKAKYEIKIKLIRDGKVQDLEIKMPRKLKTTEL